MRIRRFLLALLVALGLAPGLFWREDPPPLDYRQEVLALPLALPEGTAPRIGGANGPLLTGAWHLTSPNEDFGSYSALLVSDGGAMLAISDRGRFLRMAVPGKAVATPTLGAILPGNEGLKSLQDMESIARDPDTGRLWIGLESRNAILRLQEDFAGMEIVQPEAMRHWPGNGGAESMVRLGDGRFIVLSEGTTLRRGAVSEGLLFPGDPLEGGDLDHFALVPPPGSNPTDMALLPDGRVLILLRGFEFMFPPRFASALIIADPATIRAGEPWNWEMVAAFDDPVPHENYEGLAVTGGENGGPVNLWIISDDNRARAVQRSLLLRFEWQVPARSRPHEKARGEAARFSDSEN